MSKNFKTTCLEAILSLDSSLREMQLPASKTARAYDLIAEFTKECQNDSLQGVGFAAKLRYFLEFFSRELMPGGIVLSPKAS